jgi:osmotically-inducible protein OsmY
MVKTVPIALALALSATLLSGCAAPVVLAGAAAGSVAVAHDRRSAGTQLDDNAAEFKAKAAIAEDKELADNSHINVTAFSGVVLISGETRRQDLRSRIEQLVRNVAASRKVYNEVVVGEPAATGARLSDSWISTKIKSKLLANEDIDGSRVKVVTEAGSVFLMGLVTRAEANIATAVASDTGGVARIVRVFEYID